MGRQVDVYEYLGEPDPNVPVETGDCAACGHRWTAHGVGGCLPAEVAGSDRVEFSCSCCDYVSEPVTVFESPPCTSAYVPTDVFDAEGVEVVSDDSLGFKIGSLFSGVGGLELGLELAGVGEVVWQVEKDEWRRGKLALNWPGVERYEDVCSVTGNEEPQEGMRKLSRVDLICGGFP